MLQGKFDAFNERKMYKACEVGKLAVVENMLEQDPKLLRIKVNRGTPC